MMDYRAYALALLSRREHSQWELSKKLQAKGAASAECSTVLASLVRAGLQSDQRFAEAYTYSRLQAGFARRMIVMELKRRGVDGDVIEHTLENYDQDFWDDHLYAVWQKKYGETNPNSSKMYAKQARFLLQRGFEPEAVRRLLGSVDMK